MKAPEEPAPDLVGGVVVRVVHHRARRLGHELVGERLPGRDRLLGHERHAVHEEVVEVDAVEVDPGRLLQVVLEGNPDRVALGDPDRRPRPLGVVAEGLDGRHHLVDPPLHLVDGQLEDLDVAVEGRRERGDEVVEQELRHLGERRRLRELGVVVCDAEDVGELVEHLFRVDRRERRREVAQVAADDVAGLDVVLAPARRDLPDRLGGRRRRRRGRRHPRHLGRGGGRAGGRRRRRRGRRGLRGGIRPGGGRSGRARRHGDRDEAAAGQGGPAEEPAAGERGVEPAGLGRLDGRRSRRGALRRRRVHGAGWYEVRPLPGVTFGPSAAGRPAGCTHMRIWPGRVRRDPGPATLGGDDPGVPSVARPRGPPRWAREPRGVGDRARPAAPSPRPRPRGARRVVRGAGDPRRGDPRARHGDRRRLGVAGPATRSRSPVRGRDGASPARPVRARSRGRRRNGRDGLARRPDGARRRRRARRRACTRGGPRPRGGRPLGGPAGGPRRGDPGDDRGARRRPRAAGHRRPRADPDRCPLRGPRHPGRERSDRAVRDERDQPPGPGADRCPAPGPRDPRPHHSREPDDPARGPHGRPAGRRLPAEPPRDALRSSASRSSSGAGRSATST